MLKLSFSRIAVVAIACIIIIGQSSCSIVRLAREVSRDNSQNSYQSQSSDNPKPVRGNVIEKDLPFGVFELEILNDFKREDFSAIELKADMARKDKERFAGGYWKIAIIYNTLSGIYTDGYVSEQMWKSHLEKVERWKERFPASITARIALAKSYIGYGWFARRSGFANTVKPEDWDKTHKRLDRAYNELIEAEKLIEKCPEWYAAMLFLAMAQSWDANQYERLLDEAIRFEPNYYYYYYHKGENSSPRWSGRDGDWERFAVELENLDSKERNLIYFLYVSNKICFNYDEWTDRRSISWERIKLGYKELETTYGTDKQRLNQYALVAAINEDMPETYRAFKQIGDNWDSDVFSEERFYEIKKWAIARYEAENPR